jgi:hypothetical protein
MSDILLIYSPDKKAFAGTLAEAARDAGYGVVPCEVAEADAPSIPGLARPAAAALLVWSRPLVSSATLEGWFASVRQLPNLIEVSADGIAPPSPDDTRVVLLSGWRGQPFHLGWQRILAELKALCGTRKPAPRPSPAAGVAPPGRPPEASARGDRDGPPPRQRKGGFVVAAAAALVAGVGGLALMERKPSAPVPVAPAQGPAVSPATPDRAPAPEPAPAAPGEPASAVAPAAQAPPAAPAPVSHGPAPKAAHRFDGGPTKRYSPRFSKTMRQFCARSGRSTPQCRIFLRSTRAR